MPHFSKISSFEDSLNTQFVGEIITNGYNSVQINLKVHQKVQIEGATIPTYTLNIYETNEAFASFSNPFSNNVNKMKLIHSINLKCSVYSQYGGNVIIDENNDYNKVVNSKTKYMFFTISNPSVKDLQYHFNAISNVNSVEEYKIRDAVIELDDKALLIKPLTNFNTDVQNREHKGISSWNMSVKGDLVSTEYLLYEDGIQTEGYFDTSGGSHKVNQIIAKSSSALDAHPSGIGALSINVFGLDVNYNEVKESIFMNGTTEIFLSKQMTDINYCEVASAGSLYTNAGIITIYNNDVNGGTATNPMAVIPLNAGIHHNSQYTVPSGFTLLIHKISVINFCEDNGELYFNKIQWVNPNNTGIVKQRLKTINLNSNNTFTHNVSMTINERERFTISGQTSVSPTGLNTVSVNVWGYLKKNSFTASSNDTYNDNKFLPLQ